MGLERIRDPGFAQNRTIMAFQTPFFGPESQRFTAIGLGRAFWSVRCSTFSHLKNGRFLRVLCNRERKLQKGVDRIQRHPYMPSHRRGADGFHRLRSIGRQHKRIAGPPVQIGDQSLSAL